MQSEFAHIPLDRLRYGLVWEDHTTLYQALDLGPDDHALIITSAGCNVLNALLAGPRHVTAIDLNPLQNQLLALKAHAIAHHPPAVLRGLLGLAGPAAVATAVAALQATLPAADYAPSTLGGCCWPGSLKATLRASCLVFRPPGKPGCGTCCAAAAWPSRRRTSSGS
jgi:hypothetical protein